MNREKRYATIDTETVGGFKEKYHRAYDIGAVAYSKSEVFDEIRILVLENLADIDTAFYCTKRDLYFNGFMKDPRVVICCSEREAQDVLEDWLAEWEIDCISAYNSGFDYDTLIYDVVKNYPFVDIMEAFVNTIAQTKRYQNFCFDHEYITKAGRPQTSVEIAVRYLSGDTSFIEDHTALEDAIVEKEILKAVLKTHKKFTQNVHHQDTRSAFYLPRIA